jgi:tellurite resistance protein TehA-like permease
MGAAAITVLAAAQLLLAGTGRATIGTGPVTVLAVAFWLLATALIPLLAVVSWRRLRRPAKAPRYHAELWMFVFPAGMYSVASTQLGAAAGSSVLVHVGTAAAWPALAAWALTFTAMVARSPGRTPRCR